MASLPLYFLCEAELESDCPPHDWLWDTDADVLVCQKCGCIEKFERDEAGPYFLCEAELTSGAPEVCATPIPASAPQLGISGAGARSCAF